MPKNDYATLAYTLVVFALSKLYQHFSLKKFKIIRQYCLIMGNYLFISK